MRRGPILSPRNSAAPRVISTGLISMIAVASASPMNCNEVKNNPTEASCISARANCILGWRVRNCTSRRPRKITAKIIRLPTKRVQTTCTG